MKPSVSFEAFRSFIEHQLQPPAFVPQSRPRPFVTISRQAGAGGTTVSQKLAERLQQSELGEGGWAVMDKTLAQKVIEDHALPQRISAYLSEEKARFIESVIEECLGLHPPLESLVERVAHTILSLATMGNVILVGRGANIITACLPHGFHVRLVGSVEKRTAHLAEVHSLSRDEAARLLKVLDQGRKAYVKQHYSKDIDDPTLYHLTINTDRVSYEDAAALIAEGLIRHVRASVKGSPAEPLGRR